ncbi:MAG: biotin--[acetyl-CoA-carboxylase] ligase, partial [Clostridia bacterium]|nr:biotin--[acetyl-CoA-carboxylase] ligase [Clostridia bacterium]
GRGRMGRCFYSPEGGLYMSILLRQADPALLTVAAATAAAEAAEGLCGRPVGIKWVNDVYLDGRKVCGILAERITGIDDCLVVGFGVNITEPSGGFPPEAGMAGALFTTAPPDAAENLAADLLERFCRYAGGAPEAYLPGYRARSVLDGQEVEWRQGDTFCHGLVLGIADNGGLRVEVAGEERVLSSGEVTLHRE